MSLSEDRAADPTGFHRNTRLACLGMGGWFRSEILGDFVGTRRGRLQWPIQEGAAGRVARTRATGTGATASGNNITSTNTSRTNDPAEHLEIERRRFSGGLPPTPELYALAREQWYRLPGVLVRPSMDPAVGDRASGEAQPPGEAHPDGNGPER
jgi:hypothetical protein